MNIDVKLNFTFGYTWYKSKNIYVKGYLFDQNDILYKEESLIDYFYDVKKEEEFEKKLREANGIFSVIIVQGDVVFVAVDRIRTFPLFYCYYQDDLIISDDVGYIKGKHKLLINDKGVSEFLSTGFVTGKYTLVNDVYQVQAGQYCIFSKNTISKFYHTYLTLETEVARENRGVLVNKLTDILNNIANRMIEFANGRKLVIPLSGGLDSRLIVSLLKQKKYENVICYTYGKKDSFEVHTSKQVAKKLGYEWFFIEYDDSIISPEYLDNALFKNYYRFASNYTSVFLLQDYFAIKYLKENNIINEDSVIVPGHSGDFLGGSHLRSSANITFRNLVKLIIKKHYIFNDCDENIRNLLIKKFQDVEKVVLPYSIYEDFNLKERQSKFIVNSNRIYEFFGCQHIIPLWDFELVDFFRMLPIQYKKTECLYNDVIFKYLFKPLGVDFVGREKKFSVIIRKMKNIIKLILPKSITKTYIMYNYKDINGFYLMCNPMLNEINDNIHCSDIDFVIAKWYIKNVLEKG